jgi:hypothetical protein
MRIYRRIFITETTPVLSLRCPEWRSYKPSDSGIRGLLNQLIMRFDKWCIMRGW